MFRLTLGFTEPPNLGEMSSFTGGKQLVCEIGWGEKWVEPCLCSQYTPSWLAQGQLYMFTVGGIVNVTVDPLV